jgi:hypothetical protein
VVLWWAMAGTEEKPSCEFARIALESDSEGRSSGIWHYGVGRWCCNGGLKSQLEAEYRECRFAVRTRVARAGLRRSGVPWQAGTEDP